jgi:hypothetical protein
LTSAVVGSDNFHVTAALPPAKSSRYPLGKRLGVPESRFGRYEEVKVLTLPELELEDEREGRNMSVGN